MGRYFNEFLSEVEDGMTEFVDWTKSEIILVFEASEGHFTKLIQNVKNAWLKHIHELYSWDDEDASYRSYINNKWQKRMEADILLLETVLKEREEKNK